MEAIVLRVLQQPDLLPEEWEKLRGADEPPPSELELFIENTLDRVERQGAMLAQLAVRPATRNRLQESANSALERVPAWMEAAIFGPPRMTPRLFVRGLAQVLAEQRQGVELLLREQVADPEPLDAMLAAAPVPEGGEEETEAELARGVGAAMTAHVQTMLGIARDLDERFRRLLENEANDPPAGG
ncbi:MAG: hypothetical protein ACM3N0_12625 [Chloroflexota bacterium]